MSLENRRLVTDILSFQLLHKFKKKKKANWNQQKKKFTYQNSRRLRCHEPRVFGCLHLGKKCFKKKKERSLFCEEFGTEQGYL